MSIAEKFIDAVELLATQSVKRADYDKTIQAQIISCEDATIGKYKCRYQDAIIYAYAENPDITYSEKALVYISVPGNNMSKEKIIRGTAKKLGINYISQAQGDQAYNIIGTNCITLSNKFYLDTSNKDYKYILYNDEKSDIELDIIALEENIKQSSSLIVGATFKTSISPQKQYRGHYGITYKLRFTDNASGGQVIKSYTVDEDNMVDNPYRLTYDTRQYQIFDIDGSNFIKIESIQIFNKDFPNALGEITEEKLQTGDIEITLLELTGAVRMTESEINGVAISFYTPQGTFFTGAEDEKPQKKIVAQVRIKGKLASAAQNIPFYWGLEHVGISPNSQYYNKYLGRGWKCLNDKNIISDGNQNTQTIVEWIPGSDTYIFNRVDATARENRIKVAIVYDGTVVVKQIIIKNLNTNIPKITIQSSEGTQFYYDIGHPTLTCKVNDGEPDGYKYYWGYQDNTGVFNELSTTTDDNDNYEQLTKNLEKLESSIKSGENFINAKTNELNTIKNSIKEYNLIQRIQNNKVYDVQIRNITSFGTFKCSVFNDKDIYLGTASITLTNTLEGENLYSLVINNGSVTFQYNEDGISPTSKSLQVPQQIQALSFTIYDNLGNPIDSEVIQNTKNCEITWRIPLENTMLIDLNEDGSDKTSIPNKYVEYSRLNLLYGIANGYNIQKQNNQIELTVKYNEMNLTTRTNFTFVKQGEPGTNGTGFLVKLVPNTKMNNPPLWPMITKAGSNYILNYGLNSDADETTIGINTETGYQLFKAQLWHSGELVWEGMTVQTDAQDGVTKPSLVKWEMLKNQYSSSVSDNSAFSIKDSGEGYINYSGDHLEKAFQTPLANIVKCSVTWQDKTYYGTIPIITAWVINENYRIRLKDNTGFRYVLYTSDGINPQYDNSNPFEFICEEKINEIWEDVSLVQGDHAIIYTPTVVGNQLSIKNSEAIANNSNLLQILTNSIYRDGCEKNQWKARPASQYNGACVNTAICCQYQQKEPIGTKTRIVGKINVPIHYLLNKYGMAHINAWDGNSVQVSSDGGYILSPQMGAGNKDDQNNFTGVLMGQVKTAGKNSTDIGLLGYSNGDRTFFLDSQTGAAILGKNTNNEEQGRIIIDPSSKKALLFSSNYWNSNNYNENGLPKDYSAKSSSNGMLIDLSTPQIRFGSGKFYVDSKGELYATGGVIAGWTIESGKLTSQTTNSETKQFLTLSSTGKIYSNQHAALSNSGNGFYLSSYGLSIGSKFKVTNTGVMYIGTGATVGEGAHWTINGNSNRSYIAYGGNSMSDITGQTKDKNGKKIKDIAQVYIGTDGISLGNRFEVTNEGYLTAYRGTIGGWKIGANELTSTSGFMKLTGSGEISGGNPEYADSKGNKHNYSWSISQNGVATFNYLKANNTGSIGGWTIGSESLTGGNMTINSEGSIYGSGWSIDKNGKASFSKLAGTVPSGYTLNLNGLLGGSGSLAKGAGLSGSGMRLGGSGVGSYINPSGVSAGNGYTLEGHFNTLYADKAEFSTLKTKVANIDKAMITTATVQNLISTGTLTFYDGARPVKTTIPGVINRIYSAISSLSSQISSLSSRISALQSKVK